MKKLLLALAFGVASTAALAQSAKVPTGIDVKGPTHYRLVPVLEGHKLVYLTDVCDAQARHKRETQCLNEANSASEQAAREGRGIGEAVERP